MPVGELPANTTARARVPREPGHDETGPRWIIRSTPVSEARPVQEVFHFGAQSLERVEGLSAELEDGPGDHQARHCEENRRPTRSPTE